MDAVLGNPAVKLVHYVGGKDVPVRNAPTAADVAGLGDDYYLDLPGDPLNIKCPAKGSYATDFETLRNEAKAPPVTYAHIARETGHEGLVVQYWPGSQSGRAGAVPSPESLSWQFIQQEIMFKNRSIREAFNGSSHLVRGRWWRTLRVAAVLALISIITGPVLGFFLIFLNFSPITVNLIGSVVFALLIPYVAIGRTLLYFDLETSEEAEEAAGLSRRHWFSRARPAPSTG